MKKPPAEIIQAFPPELLEKLIVMRDRLVAWNRKFALTSVADDEIFDRLIAPSAWLGSRYGMEEVGAIADFGSGPGVPGLAMALADHRNRYILIDSSQKKIGFIKHCLTVKDLYQANNVEARLSRVEPGEYKEKFDRVVTRATGSMLSTIKLWEGKVKESGAFDFFKGSGVDAEIEELEAAIPTARVEELKTPGWFGHLKILRVYFT
ncbi:hypothetical protein MNBD_NITROSPINAE04-2300 [hydrothermal vent metagenome]|uniref:Uncharacterized protein n=1 Tax=hydrothermal vent metagenome TaxID=652676 RepID=A0A3B1CJW6_9ZZZZ